MRWFLNAEFPEIGNCFELGKKMTHPVICPICLWTTLFSSDTTQREPACSQRGPISRPVALAPVALNGSRLRREKNNGFGAALNQRCLSRPLRHPLGYQDRIYFVFIIFLCVQSRGEHKHSLPSFRASKSRLVTPGCFSPSSTFQWTWGLVITDERRARISFLFSFSFCFFYCSSQPGCEMWPLIRSLRAASARSSCSTTTRSLCICGAVTAFDFGLITAIILAVSLNFT